MDDDLSYPDPETIYEIYEKVLERDSNADPGVVNEGNVEFAVDYVKRELPGEGPETIHEKAAHLMRLLASSHTFVDGNKRTTLGTVTSFYNKNGYNFDYEDDSVRDLLKRLARDQSSVDINEVVDYLENHTHKQC